MRVSAGTRYRGGQVRFCRRCYWSALQLFRSTLMANISNVQCSLAGLEHRRDLLDNETVRKITTLPHTKRNVLDNNSSQACIAPTWI
jgi:hypothetical protein